jgi:hypothetical protein
MKPMLFIFYSKLRTLYYCDIYTLRGQMMLELFNIFNLVRASPTRSHVFESLKLN